jgi:hypothetical protein
MIEVLEFLLTMHKMWKEFSNCFPYRLQPKYYSSLLIRLGFRGFLLQTKDVVGNLENSLHSQDESSDN